jgi:glutathione S-transferase
MKLHYNPFSHNSRRAVAVIQHLGLNVEMSVVDVFKGEHKSSEYLRLNPNGMVPTLEDNGFVLWESNSIMQYLCERKGETTLWPRDIQLRADITRWQFWQIAHFNTVVETIIFEKMFKGLIGIPGGPDAEIVAEAEKSFNRFATVLNNHLEGRDYLAGEQWTLADFAIGSSLTYANAIALPVDNFKRVAAWNDRLNQLEAWRKSAPPPMPGR